MDCADEVDDKSMSPTSLRSEILPLVTIGESRAKGYLPKIMERHELLERFLKLGS